jgi:2-keto-3-deoxy-L-rhamnonate aldolase RhmA
MLENKVKRILSEGGTVIGTAMSMLRQPESVRPLAAAGFDYLFIDMEHSTYDLEEVKWLCRECRLCGIVPLVRPPDPEYHLMARSLDSGAMGLVVPRISSVEQVEKIVSSVKYPPMGARGNALKAVMSDYEKVSVSDYIEWSNREILVVIQIENVEALSNLDAILSVEGVDAVMIGPNDLAISLGIPQKFEDPIFEESLTKVMDACERCNVAPGIHFGDIKLELKWIGRGMRFATFSSEMGFLSEGALGAAKRLKKVAKVKGAIESI